MLHLHRNGSLHACSAAPQVELAPLCGQYRRPRVIDGGLVILKLTSCCETCVKTLGIPSAAEMMLYHAGGSMVYCPSRELQN